jgi:hypothetical protein
LKRTNSRPKHFANKLCESTKASKALGYGDYFLATHELGHNYCLHFVMKDEHRLKPLIGRTLCAQPPSLGYIRVVNVQIFAILSAT